MSVGLSSCPQGALQAPHDPQEVEVSLAAAPPGGHRPRRRAAPPGVPVPAPPGVPVPPGVPAPVPALPGVLVPALGPPELLELQDRRNDFLND